MHSEQGLVFALGHDNTVVFSSKKEPVAYISVVWNNFNAFNVQSVSELMQFFSQN